MRATLSPPSSPEGAASSASPAPPTKDRASKKRSKNKSKMAGLVGGDSDSSALTQESGDEGVALTPRESVLTGTDAGTEELDQEDVEMRDPSPGRFSFLFMT